jgi:hypothetical protein
MGERGNGWADRILSASTFSGAGGDDIIIQLIVFLFDILGVVVKYRDALSFGEGGDVDGQIVVLVSEPVMGDIATAQFFAAIVDLGVLLLVGRK